MLYLVYSEIMKVVKYKEFKRALPGWDIPDDPDKTVLVQPEKWEEFIKNSGLVLTELYQYYLNSPLEHLTSDDYNKLMSELFADCVGVDAIVIPSPYKAEDFELKVRATGVPNHEWATVTLKGKPSFRGRLAFVGPFLSKNQLLSSDQGRVFISEVGGIVKYLIAEKESSQGGGSQVVIEPARRRNISFLPSAREDMRGRGWLGRKLLARKIKKELMKPTSAVVFDVDSPEIKRYGVYIEKLYVTFSLCPTWKECPLGCEWFSSDKLGCRIVNNVR